MNITLTANDLLDHRDRLRTQDCAISRKVERATGGNVTYCFFDGRYFEVHVQIRDHIWQLISKDNVSAWMDFLTRAKPLLAPLQFRFEENQFTKQDAQ